MPGSLEKRAAACLKSHSHGFQSPKAKALAAERRHVHMRGLVKTQQIYVGQIFLQASVIPLLMA